ncbi:MAG: GNAT family N-acetyltransferase [Propionibacteriaceae bacterium]
MAILRRINPLSGDSADLDLWRQSWRLWNAGTRRQYGPDSVQIDADTLLERLRLSGDPFVHIVATERDVVVGRIDAVKNSHDDSDVLFLEFGVMPPWRDQGLGHALWNAFEPEIAGLNVTALESHTTQRLDADPTDGAKAANHILENLDFVPVQRSIVSELVLDNSLPTPDLADGYRLEVFTEVPPADLLPLLARMHQHLEEDEPRGHRPPAPKQWSAERLATSYARNIALGFKHVTVLLVDTNTDTVIGFAENTWTPKNPEVIRQGGVWVDPAHRGKGLATATKGRSIAEMLKLAPEASVNVTMNAEDNVTMTSVNNTLGYKPMHLQIAWRKTL